MIFDERMGFICRDLPTIQYADDLLVGAVNPHELYQALHKVFSRLQLYGLKLQYNKVIWITERVKFLGVEIHNGQWSLQNYLSSKAQEFQKVNNIKGLEHLIGLLSYCRRCVPKLEHLLCRLRQFVAEYKEKKGTVTSEWWTFVTGECVRVYESALSGMLVLTSPNMIIKQFRLEVDWSGQEGQSGHAGYVLFGIDNTNHQHLLDMGSGVMKGVSSSYLGELRSLKWACEKTRMMRGDVITSLCTDNLAVCQKLSHEDLTSTDKRVVRLWGWLLANESSLVTSFVPGEDNVAADILSRPVMALTQRRSLGDTFDKVRNAIWKVHRDGHWSERKMVFQLHQQGYEAPRKLIAEVLKACPVCSKFRVKGRRAAWGQPPTSVTPGECVVMDVIGPLVPGRGGVQYVHCLIDSCTRLGEAHVYKNVSAQNMVQSLQAWVAKHGVMKLLYSDGASYNDAYVMNQWCKHNNVEQRFIAPHMHNSLGLIERFQRTLTDRLRKFKEDIGGSWSDHLARAVTTIQEMRNEGTGWAPIQLWSASLQQRKEAAMKARRSVDRKDEGKKFIDDKLEVGKLVWCHDAVMDTSRMDKFSPRWKGPYVLEYQVSRTLWKVKSLQHRRKAGRQPSLVYHVNQLRPYMQPLFRI